MLKEVCCIIVGGGIRNIKHSCLCVCIIYIYSQSYFPKHMAFNWHLEQTSNPSLIADSTGPGKVFNKCLLSECVSEWMVWYNHSRVGLERDLGDHLIQPACLTARVQSREVTRPSTHIKLLLESRVETPGSHLPCHHFSYYISPPANVIFYLPHLRSH